MNERQQEALAALTPEQQAAVLAGHEKWVAEREEARREALEAEVAANECCQSHNGHGEALARKRGYRWNLEPCPQHRDWPKISWLIHGMGRGQTAGDFDAAA